jgi:NYN domain
MAGIILVVVSEPPIAPQRVAVFLDYQNVLQVGHGLYARGREVHQCVPEPSLVADLIARRRNVPSEVTDILVYRGRPNPLHEPTLAQSNDRQAAQWTRRDPRVRMIRHPLYYRNWPDDPPIEKGVDVSLAIDLVQFTLRQQHAALVVFSSDMDLMPAIDLCFGLPSPPVIEVACWSAAKPLQRPDRQNPGMRLPFCHFLPESDWRRVIRDWTGR